MMAYNFRTPASSAAGGTASEGRGKLTQHLPLRTSAAAHFTNRAALPTVDEQLILHHLIATAGPTFPPSQLIDFYISLKTNPFVVLTGPEGAGKAAFVRGFADALIGPDNPQYVVIPGGSWIQRTGKHSFYRSIHDRFGSLRFLETLHEAAEPHNAGKLYMVCLQGLHPGELHWFFSEVLCVSPAGERHLALPGLAPDQQPSLPPNLYIAATLNVADMNYARDREVLVHAGLIEFRGDPYAVTLPPPAPTPPVGYQRLFMAASVRDLEEAQRRLLLALGPGYLGRLQPSPGLMRLLWHGGVVFSTALTPAAAMYVANSFDAAGRGLIDPHDPPRNARLAYDAHVVQRVLWRLRGADDQQLLDELAAFCRLNNP